MKKRGLITIISLIIIGLLLLLICTLANSGQNEGAENETNTSYCEESSIESDSAASSEGSASVDATASEEPSEPEESFEESGDDGHPHNIVEISRSAATYDSEGSITYKCTDCDYQKIVTSPKLEHIYSQTWSYDEEYHWHKCTDKGYDELKADYSLHNFKAGEKTSATYDSAEYTQYICDCGYSKQVKTGEALSHTYSSKWSFDDTSHWHSCTDKGYESLKADESSHTDSNEVILHATTATQSGLARYTCAVCGHTYEKTIYLKTEIKTNPTVASSTVYIGQTLSAVKLSGGKASVSGSFAWTNKNEIITKSGYYGVTFTPTEKDVYETLYTEVYVTAEQLTVTVSAGEHGTATPNGTVKVNYGDSLTVKFSANNGYEIGKIEVGNTIIDACESYTFKNITSNKTISVSFDEIFIEIKSNPTVASSTVYIGQTLSAVELSGGKASVSGSFAWTNKNEIITKSGYYGVTFTPTEKEIYETLYTEVYVSATQLTVTVSVGEHGTATPNGTVKVNYGDSLTVSFSADDGYEIGKIEVGNTVIDACESYTFKNITSNKTISVSFDEVTSEQPGSSENWTFTVVCESGTPNCYTYDGTTLYFTSVSSESVYSITGTLDGNIIIDTGDSYKFDLEFKGFTQTCSSTNPITVLSGDEVSLQAKKDSTNYIYDKRAAIDSTDTTLYSAAIYSLVDLEISGKGNLTVVSDNNNGIHTKDDLQVKNLTLSVTCQDNALKGNDGVEITDATTTLIAKTGDCIKSTNSHINENTQNQKGTIYISGGTHNLYAACDGIDSAYNVLIDNDSTVLNIYTDKYSQYSETVTVTSGNTYYLRYSSTGYKYSVRYYNSSTGAEKWVNVSTSYETVSSPGGGPGGSSTYYYYTFDKLSGYDKFAVYMYSGSQAQGQDSSYYACSSYMAINDSYDTVALSTRTGTLSVSWTNYSTSTSPGGMGGGMNEGNTDKGEYSTKAIKAANEITVNAGKITLKSYDDAIHANNDGGVLENGANPTGNVTINGGNITVYSNDDGLHADGTLNVTNGTVNVTNAYEGVEGAYVKISGGSVSVICKDDGINATATSGAAIEISGGNVYIYCTGDGLDSNSRTSKGAIKFTGGNTVVISNSNGNSAIDSDGGYTHSGGRVVALMPSGGMTGESTNGNSSGMTTKSSLSLSSNGYLTVSTSGSTVAVVKMPCNMNNAYVVYLGSSSASISSSTSNSNTLDSNGVYWK